ncbi:glycoprotein-N-acetylgalactosamine 3-beta-galactosyltransferase 1-like [Macrobrachium nipponense]|uniref:glycoprotein-N-acetylgalactosamine 3-beta-galactosyltransferase 1-like n=1 Tax=Macrobrachium nipponense TaxID=159736 RepID=UPI0030C8D108
MTTPKRKGSALAVKNTWGKRCDKLIFFADKLDEGLESVKLSDVQEEWKYLWSKSRRLSSICTITTSMTLTGSTKLMMILTSSWKT